MKTNMLKNNLSVLMHRTTNLATHLTASVRVCMVAMLGLLFPMAAWSAGIQVLRGHVPAAVSRLAPAGRTAPSMRLNLAIGLPLRNQGGLTKLLHDLYDPTSPSYRQYLSPAQFAEMFGPTESDYQAVVGFAKANGLTVTATHPNRVIVDVAGSVSEIEKAFHVTMLNYQHPTETRQFYAPNTEPSLDLAVPILHISGLDNYSIPHPNFKVRPAGLTANATPNAGSGPGGAYAGGDFRAAYVPETTLTGVGQSVGLLQFDGYYPNDIAAYRTQFGLPNIPLVNVPVDGGVSTPGGGNGEVCLDIEMVMSMAPGVSTIYVYEAHNPSPWVDLLSRMANDNLSKQLSCSWGGGGPDASAEAIFQQMAAQGQSFYNATGDSDAFTGSIDFPSESPNITEVGATTLTTSGAGGSYLSETVWNWGGGTGSSGGISTYYSIPTWQTGVNMTTNLGSTTMRNVPDVALTGDNIYVKYGNGSSGVFGGTSCAAPLWAGFTALVNQQAVANGFATVGFLNPTLYSIGTGGSYTTDFHDTTSGNNFSPSSPALFPAVTGFDLCTGWGSPAGTALINTLAGPPEDLQVSYAAFAASGPIGGPFTPGPVNYTLTNSGTSPLSWTASAAQSWLSLLPSGGTLLVGGSATVTASINSAANMLGSGTYGDTITFTNTTTSGSATRPVALTVLLPPPVSTGVLTSGSTGSTVNGEPAGTYYVKLGVPSVNDTGKLAFQGQIKLGTVAKYAVLTGSNPAVLVRQGDASHDVSGATFKSFNDPLLSQAGAVAFEAKLSGTAAVTAATSTGLWSDAFGGGLRKVARTGDLAVSGLGAKILSFTSVALESGTVATPMTAYVAKLNGSGVTKANDVGLWSCDGTTTRLLLREGMDMTVGASAKTLSTFTVLGKTTGAEGQGFGLSNGVMTVLLTFIDKSVAVATIHADGSDPDVVAAAGDAAPGYGGGALFKTFKLPGQNSNGGPVFLATMNGAVASANNSAIYEVTGGAGGVLDRIVSKGVATPNVVGLFDTFNAAANNGSDRVVFSAKLSHTGMTGNALSVWEWDGTGYQIIAQQGSAAAGCGGASWKSFSSVALPDYGDPLFTAVLNKGTGSPAATAANDSGLWSRDSLGTMHLLVREGVTAIGGKTVKSFTVLTAIKDSPSQTRSFNGAGTVVYLATFADKTQGIVEVQMP